MTEREFDKFFKDRIGDEEQSFDFRTDDWLAAAHELDKVLPVAAPVVIPPTRFLTWHKWSAAAAVVFLASQVWLIAKIMDLKYEVSSLKQENVALTQPEKSVAPEKRLETVVQYDTVYKSVVIEKPIYKTQLLKDNATPSQLAENNKALKNNVPAIDKNDLKTTEKSNNIDITGTNNSLDNNNLNALRGQDALAALPNLGLQTVKSNNRETAVLDMSEWLLLQKRTIIQPAPLMTNGWTLGVNSLSVLSECGSKKSKVNLGANVRLTYDLRSNWRLTADVNFWKESRPSPDTISHRPPFTPPSPDYRLSKVDLKSKNIAMRIGADYEWINKSAVTPFIGFGFAYQLKTEDKIEFQYRKPGKPNFPIAIRNDERDNDKPLSLSFRVGAMGKIYRRLGWSVNIGKELPFSGRTNQLLSGQVGFSYAL